MTISHKVSNSWSIQRLSRNHFLWSIQKTVQCVTFNTKTRVLGRVIRKTLLWIKNVLFLKLNYSTFSVGFTSSWGDSSCSKVVNGSVVLSMTQQLKYVKVWMSWNYFLLNYGFSTQFTQLFHFLSAAFLLWYLSEYHDLDCSKMRLFWHKHHVKRLMNASKLAKIESAMSMVVLRPVLNTA